LSSSGQLGASSRPLLVDRQPEHTEAEPDRRARGCYGGQRIPPGAPETSDFRRWGGVALLVLGVVMDFVANAASLYI
jgi:hypothetical protein